ncbi:hypothetical protein PENTCL1PPCAC_30072, partial [Pristionchus entomophagus]
AFILLLIVFHHSKQRGILRTMASSQVSHFLPRGPLPAGGTAPIDVRAAVVPPQKITRLMGGTRQIMATCPICKLSNIRDWRQLKLHVKRCYRKHQHPLLMRVCYCPYCLKKMSDAYLLSSHIKRCHSTELMNLWYTCSEYESSIIEIEGINVDQMAEDKFPFMCSACHICWPDVTGIAEHFTAMEREARPCGGTLYMIYSEETELTADINSITFDRYDFPEEKGCPYCTKTFGEAFALSHHIERDHKAHQDRLERKLPNNISMRKLRYAPFYCTNCHCSFKRMEEWAQHYHEFVETNRRPCNGELSVVKFGANGKSESNGKRRFVLRGGSRRVHNVGNRIVITDQARVPPLPMDTNMHVPSTDEKEKKEEHPGSHSDERVETSNQQKIKDEPIDPDEAEPECEGSHPKTSALKGKDGVSEVIPDDPLAPGKKVIKDEPLDDESTTTCAPETVVKEEPKEEEEPSSSSGQNTMPRADASPEREEYDCDECNLTFTDSKSYVQHMKIHGYELAEDMDEEEIAKIEAGEDNNEPPAKKMRPNQPSTSPYPTALPEGDQSDQLLKCKHCSKMFATLGEYNRHMLNFHNSTMQGTPQAFPCTVCRNRKFATDELRMRHEKACAVSKLSEARDRAFNESILCIYCKYTCANAYLLGRHVMVNHQDTIEKLRKHHQLASEFLPFRCSACKVGYETPQLLMDHFRLREEFGIACTGNLQTHSYKTSIEQRIQEEDRHANVPIPGHSIMDDEANEDITSNEWCPRDPAPSDEVDKTWRVQCPECKEQWPRAQIKLHVKMEHPKYYYEQASFKCKTCKQYGFLCPSRYQEHYETCSPTNIGIADKRELVCAPRCDLELNKRPTSIKWNLPSIPDNMGNEVRQCRYCDSSFSPEAMIQHRKNEHPVEHFTDSPYHCQQCGDVGFYKHVDFKHHGSKCTGSIPLDFQGNSHAIITVKEVETLSAVRRRDIPSFRALIDADRRKNGTFTALRRPLLCPFCNWWCSSMFTLNEHYRDCHHKELRDGTAYNCGGCGVYFTNIIKLKDHLRNQDVLGNPVCYDMAVVQGNRATNVITHNHGQSHLAPPVDPNAQMHTSSFSAGIGQQRDHSFNDNWRPEQSYSNRPSFMNLARKEATEKKMKPTQQLLPIRPINIMSKSPLSGERTLYRQQQVEASKNRSSIYFKELSVQQKQRSFVRVDPSTPLEIKPHLLTDASTSRMQPNASPLTARPARPSFTRPNVVVPRLQQHPSSFHPMTTTRLASLQSSSTMRFRPIHSPPPQLVPESRPSVISQRKVTKIEPKQEPIYLD